MIAEVTIGDLPFGVPGLVAAVFVLPIYGAGALLVREVVVRRGAGAGAVLLLGAAYALVEEGLALQSLFSPTIYGGLGPAWGVRLLGVNGTYTLVQLVNHAVWSVGVPIALTEVAFPGHRGRPYVGRAGLTVTGLLYLVGVGLTALARGTLDPDHRTPAPLLVATAAAVVVLVAVALRRSAPRPSTSIPIPSPGGVAGVASTASFAFLAVLVLPGHLLPALMGGPVVVVPVALAVATVAVAGRHIARWSRAVSWDDRHLLALAGGATVGHTLLWGLTQPRTDADRVGVVVLLLLTLVLLARLTLLARRTAAREPVH